MRILFCLLLFAAVATSELNAQSSFSFTPSQPQSGEVITVTYSPSGPLANSKKPVLMKFYTFRSSNYHAFDGNFKKSGNQYVATIPTDTADNLVGLYIYNDDGVDNNNNAGFVIPLFKGDSLKTGAAYSEGLAYGSMARVFGMEPNNEKALQRMQAEFEKNPDLKVEYVLPYLRLYKKVHPDDFAQEVQHTIEALLADGLKDENSYSRLQSLYGLIDLTNQADFVKAVKQERFPEGKWANQEKINQYIAEKDLHKKEMLWKDISNKIDNDPDWKSYRQSKNYYATSLVADFLKRRSWDTLNELVEKWNLMGEALAGRYISEASKMADSSEQLQQAAQLAKTALDWAKKELDDPSRPKPDSYTERDWLRLRQSDYGEFAAIYAKTQFAQHNYKVALPYIEEAVKAMEEKYAPINELYAKIAEKALAPRRYVPRLEQMVRAGTATPAIKEILKQQYLKKHNETAYEKYMAGLEKAAREKLRQELSKSMIDEESPAFALKDLDGREVRLEDLKGKVVVLDFWATWCGPCKAAFPGLQKTLTKYKADPDVVFLFINTWEDGDEKEKNARDFIKANNYDFHVLMDDEDKVVAQYNVAGIPTKFVIDKAGKIRFKSVGYNGSEDGLIQEMSIMIDMVK